MGKKVVILEIGGSHDECILSQLIGLKQAGAWIAFCGTKKMFEKNSYFAKYVDTFYEITLPQSMLGDFFEMIKLNRWFVKNNIDIVVANTAQGGHIRNLCLTASSKVKFFGIIHTIKMFEGSFTQCIISKKIKDYFVLNDTLKQYVGNKKGINIYSFYPLSYPQFPTTIDKPSDEFWVAIIGGVEYRRKDLDGFIEMTKSVPEHVHFYFLGKSDSEKVEVKRFKSHIEASNLDHRVHLFSNFVSEEEFDAYLKSMDAVFPLVHPNTPSSDEYFSRQISGAINVAFAYKIPMMIHERYKDWEDFKQGVLFYNLMDFKQKFKEFLQRSSDLRMELEQHPNYSSEFQNQHFAKIVLSSF